MSHVQLSSNYKNTGKKTMTADSKTNYDAGTKTSDVEKIKNCRKQNFEDEANNMQ